MRRHPWIHTNSLHHLRVSLTELRSEAMRGSISYHIAMIILPRMSSLRMPASFRKVLMSKGGDPSSWDKFSSISSWPKSHVMREGESRGKRRVRETLNNATIG